MIENYPPIIIIGMHRSGTSLLVQLIEQMGVFMGHEKTKVTQEALLFQKINKWLLSALGGSLEFPSAIRYLFNNNELRLLVEHFFRGILKSTQVSSYLGWRNYLKYHHLFNLDFPWGWKDPRNTFALPLWLDIFPEARVIHIYRHGVDV